MKISIDAQIEEVEREIRMRREVYPRQVQRGKLRQGEAEMLIERMVAVLKTLRWIEANREELLTEMHDV